MHVGLNGQVTPSAEKMKSFHAGFWFSNRKLDAPRATITIPSPGVHTINVWMREDGFKADKLVLVPGSSEDTFAVFGPPESPRVAGQGGGGGNTTASALPEPEHDAAGNIVVMPSPHDWTQVYACQYDAWNRLTQVSYATKQPGGSVTVGLPLAELRYDGLGRRIVYRATNTAGPQGGVGALDYAHHDYYNGQRMVETRNGSDLVARQQLWGLDYIDELVEVAHNPDPADQSEQACEERYYAAHNAQYNVLGLIAPERDANGTLTGQTLVERYEYTPYGQRSVFIASGPTDATLTQEVDRSQITATGICLNPFGHQGLHHDEATGLVYNRARMLHPGLGRFVQRDPLGYVDGMGVYESRKSNPVKLFDSRGTESVEYTVSRGCCGLEISGALTDVLSRIQQTFTGAAPDVKERVCLSLYNPSENEDNGYEWGGDAWDINELAFDKKAFTSEKCGKGGCGVNPITEGGVEGEEGTVQVNGECHRPAEVNYVLFGTINRLCSNGGFSDRLLEQFPFYRVEPLTGGTPFSEGFGNRFISVRRIAKFGGTGTEGRQAWFSKGLQGGDLNMPSTVEGCNKCDETYDGGLEAVLKYGRGPSDFLLELGF